MRDVGPPGLVVVGDLDGVPEHLLLGLRPQLADARHRQLALRPAGGVHRVLELVHRDLAEDRGDRPLDVLGQERQAAGRLGRLLEQPAEDEGLAEDGRRLGERQRGVLLEDAARPRQGGVQAVAELMGQRQDVASLVRPVQQDVRVGAGDGVGAEGAAALARTDGRVDVVAVEEDLRGVAENRGEVAERVQHELAGLVPAVVLVALRDRGHAVVVGQALDPEEPGLQAVPAARQLVGALHCVDERLHRLVAGLVGEVAPRQPAVEVAQTVVRRLVGQQRVEDEGAGAQPRLQRVGDGLLRGGADAAVRVVEPGERDVQRDGLVLAVERDLDGAGQLAEEARPRAATGDRLLGEDALLGLGQQVRAVAPRGGQVVAAALQALGGQQLVGERVVQGRPLELEELQRRLDRGRLLLHALHERADRRVRRVDAELQRRVGVRQADELGDARQLVHRGDEARAVERGDPPDVGGREGLGPFGGLVEQAVDPGRALTAHERLEVPGDGLDGGGAHGRQPSKGPAWTEV